MITMSPAALSFAVGVAMVTTLLCGLAPAIHAARGALQTRLIGAGKGVSEGLRHGKLRASLVIVEVGLSIVLLAGAGLMMRTLFAIEHVDLGLTPQISLPGNSLSPRAVTIPRSGKVSSFGKFSSVSQHCRASLQRR